MNNIFLSSLFLIAGAANAADNTLPLPGEVQVRTTTTISSKNARPGDGWSGSLAADVSRDGVVVLRRGATVEGVIDAVESKSAAPQARLSLKLVSIDGQRVFALSHEVLGNTNKRKPTRTIAGWGLTGALIGAILHGGPGAAAGAGAGAGIGAIRARGKDRRDAIIPPESILVFRAAQ